MNKIIGILFLCEGLISYIICGGNIAGNYIGLSVAFVCINTVVLIIELAREEDDRMIATVILLSYILRTGLMFFDLYGQNIFVLPNSGSDSEKFQLNAVIYALYGKNADYQGREIATTEILFGLFYRVFGVQRMLLQHYNVLLSIGTICNVIAVLKDIKIDRVIMKIGAVMICFLPNYMILSAIFLRESIIIFFISGSIRFFARWIVEKKEKNIYIAIMLSMIGSMFHTGAIVPAACYALFLLCYDKEKEKFAITSKTLVLFIIGLGGLAVLFGKFYDLFFLKLGEITSIQDITKRVGYGFGGGADYVAPGANADNIGEFLLATPIRMFYFMASPVPWLWRGMQDIIAFFLDAVPYTVAFFMGFSFVCEKEDKKKRAVVIGVFLIYILSAFMFGWGVNNAGTALRHRNKYISAEVVLIAVGGDIVVRYSRNKRKRKI